MCDQNPDCIGVANTNSGPYASLCYICLDDNLLLDGDGFNFYRKPGINQNLINATRNVYFYALKMVDHTLISNIYF